MRLSFGGCTGFVGWRQSCWERRKRFILCSKFEVPSKSIFIVIFCYLNLVQGLDKLGNWPDMLLNFQKILSKAKQPVPLSAHPYDRSPAFCLLRFIAHNNNTKSYASIEANFLFATMHLACMKDIRFPHDVCPDLPDDISSLVHVSVSFPFHLFWS